MGKDATYVPEALPLDTHPDRYIHWRLAFEGPIARLDMAVKQDQAAREGEYVLKQNSYDLGVDIELKDAIQRIRFEHPEVRCLVITSSIDRIFCSGANIYMLGSSTHTYKVNFCKYTNETRLDLEDLAAFDGVSTIAALNGTAAGGGYELALACEEIMLVDDGSSAVSFPEAPLLAVLPGTGGLTRLVDKRKVRRDRADVFSTIAEGIKGKRALQWGLVDELVQRSKWEEAVRKRAEKAVARRPEKKGAGVTLRPVAVERTGTGLRYRYVELSIDRAQRIGHLTLRAPNEPQPENAAGFHAMGERAWALQIMRELDDCLVRLRFEMPDIGLLALRSSGDIGAVLAADAGLLASQDDWLGRAILSQMRRVLRRLDLTARSIFALVEPGSCFAGSLLEAALAADRIYMLNDPDRPVHMAFSKLNAGPVTMSNGLTRLETRFLGAPEKVGEALATEGQIDTEAADELGLVTFAPDPIDWDDEVRIALEERANFSPDAMTGMEANLRFAGPETMETKIFGRLSAWQNWIFQRPNAVGERGALSLYGKQTRPVFDMTRT
jgi:benzoyl-CoA-dihydrodiol lyase